MTADLHKLLEFATERLDRWFEQAGATAESCPVTLGHGDRVLLMPADLLRDTMGYLERRMAQVKASTVPMAVVHYEKLLIQILAALGGYEDNDLVIRTFGSKPHT